MLTPTEREAALDRIKYNPARDVHDLLDAAVPVYEVVTADNVLTADETESVFFLDALAGFQTTLPAPALGLHFKFIVKTAPTSNGYTIVSSGSANIIVVSVNEVETDDTEDGATDDDADLVTFVHSVALRGDWLDFYSDGTSWYALGQCRADGGISSGTT